MDLATQTDRRLRAAGITEDHPELVRLRAWNALAYARKGHSQVEQSNVIPLNCGCPPGAGYCSRRKHRPS